MADFQKQLFNYRLTTARILYRMPDHKHLLQEYIWQEYDIAPQFPALSKFLNFWARELEGPLHAVYIANQSLITPGDYRFAAWEGTLQ
ncbi:MAG: hypothetical protein IT559_04670 [Alphaproteobacteria bacterium]|nr:hypothetical protein [Alphaproteobacteria bacterium]